MKYKNPVISGFYPDPSVCAANGKYYMVCSSFQYFPGVPLFESGDLVNWKQIGYVLTRKGQVMLEKIGSSGGVFAPTIRYHEGRFYMVTTNDSTHQNFYVYTDDIYGAWSDPVYVAQGGIDPSLYFEDGHAYFMSNGCDDAGVEGVAQCEIDIATGKKLSESRCVWHGSGGRFLESPHLYRIGNAYYLMAAEGGTEYGHMITYARGTSVWGPFENYVYNPVLTNRNKAPFLIQGIGHGDLIQDYNGEWHIFCLGFRQMHLWRPYHTLGREVFLVPVRFDENGWFQAGTDGTADFVYELKGTFSQKVKKEYTFENTDFGVDWCYLRHPDTSRYELFNDRAVLYGGGETLDDVASPTFLAMRQKEFAFQLSVELGFQILHTAETDLQETGAMTGTEGEAEVLRASDDVRDDRTQRASGGVQGEEVLRASDDVRDDRALRASDDVRDDRALRASDGVRDDRALRAPDDVQGGEALRVPDDVRGEEVLRVPDDRQRVSVPEAGITLYSCENEHYEVALIRRQNGFEVILRLNIGGIRHIQAALAIPAGGARLIVKGENTAYHFFVETEGKELYLGTGGAKYLSSEVVEGFTGVMIGCYAVGDCRAEFAKLRLVYETVG